jgi:[ribosomal protein S5]-alanine N-acetyltransferase
MHGKVSIRHPAPDDEAPFLEGVRRSAALHRPWVVAPSTPAQFQDYLVRMAVPDHCAFLVCRVDTGDLAGVVNISNIIRRAFQSGHLGYYAFAGHHGQGLMREGLRLVIRHAFGSLKLHRLEANIQPDNGPSIALVKSCGFVREGFSRKYLKVGGRWRDHERWAILAS